MLYKIGSNKENIRKWFDVKTKIFEGDREGDLWWVQSALTTKYYLISNIILSVAQGKRNSGKDNTF